MRSFVSSFSALFILAMVSCGGGGDGNGSTGGTSPTPTGGSASASTSGSRIYVGSCTGKDGNCMSQWQVPVEGLNVAAIFESVCTSEGNTYSATYVCSGGVPGCCTLPPASDGTLVKYGYKVTDGDPEGALKRQCVDGFQGTFE